MHTNAIAPQMIELSDDHMVVLDLNLKLDQYRERLAETAVDRRDPHLIVKFAGLNRLLKLSFLDVEALARDVAREGIVVAPNVFNHAICVIDDYNNGDFHRLGRTG